MNVPKILKGSKSSELRAQYLQQSFVPLARAAFERDPRVQSVVLAIGQFWCDEAADAVHIETVPCVVEDPSWPVCIRDNPFVHRERGFEELTEEGSKLCGYDAAVAYPQLDSNSSAITAFASCCAEETSQDEPMSDAYALYAIARRNADGEVALEIVGAVVRPDWEDRTDVGFDAEESPPPDVLPTTLRPAIPSAPVPLPEPTQPKPKVGWFGRLFGKS